MSPLTLFLAIRIFTIEKYFITQQIYLNVFKFLGCMGIYAIVTTLLVYKERVEESLDKNRETHWIFQCTISKGRADNGFAQTVRQARFLASKLNRYYDFSLC